MSCTNLFDRTSKLASAQWQRSRMEIGHRNAIVNEEEGQPFVLGLHIITI